MSNKLLVKHFPSQMPLQERKQLLHTFGALDVHCFPDFGKMKCCAFATFQDQLLATMAMRHLHQISILGSRLSVEYAKDDKLLLNRRNNVFETSESSEKEFEIKMKRHLSQLHNISHTLGLNYPFPPLLKYKYPTANKATVANIAKALLGNPRFYTQVLHLMNKMNMPPPFVTDENVSLTTSQNDNYAEVPIQSESESEIETEEDCFQKEVPIERGSFQRKRKKLDTGFVGSKKPRKIVQTNKKIVSVGIDDMFDSTTLQTKPNISITVTDSLPSTCDTFNIVEGGFGKIDANKSEACDQTENEQKIEDFVSDKELRDNRLTESEMKNYSVFKNYATGSISCRLYVKNLDKKVEVNDLKRIFGKFVDWNSETEQNAFDVCLLKQGRMKGQAFVTFSSEVTANNALRKTNGFQLNGKPMVVCFARSAKTT